MSFEQISDSKPYWIFFRDKDTSSFNPYDFFDQKAIQRRIKNHIPIKSYDDIPVKTSYIEEISTLCDSVIYPSRWFNAIYVYAKSSQIEQIKQLPFVKNVQEAYVIQDNPLCEASTKEASWDSSLFTDAIKIMDGEIFHERGFRGQGVRIAVFDAGFPGVDTLSVFEHLRKNHRIVATYDFRKKREHVFSYNQHGTMVLQCIAGVGKEFTLYGLATDAEFLLARTEITPEVKAEEIYWIAALEWADQHGADIVNSSLGYTYHRYFPSQMDGKTTLISKAARKAMSKGILIINAAGNDGDNDWFIVGAPADADSIISVGGVDPSTLLPTDFSSRGPTADGRLKPDVCGSGWVSVYNKHGRLTTVAGTSFATPLVTGFAACLLSSDTAMTTLELYNRIRESGHLYPYFDYANGYGIVNARKALNLPQKFEPFYSVLITKENILIQFREDTLSNPSYFYAHLEDKNGILRWYEIKKVDAGTSLSYPMDQCKLGSIFRCVFNHQYFEHHF